MGSFKRMFASFLNMSTAKQYHVNGGINKKKQHNPISNKKLMLLAAGTLILQQQTCCPTDFLSFPVPGGPEDGGGRAAFDYGG